MLKFLKKYFCCLKNKNKESDYKPNGSECDFSLKNVSLNVSISNLSDISMDSL